MTTRSKQTTRHEPLVVVFGGAGYVGSWLVRLLLKEGYRVRVFDNFLYGKDGVLGIDSHLLEVVCGDICDTRAVSCATEGAEAVVLLAAIVGHLARENISNDMRTVNLTASSAVLDCAVEHGASRFIFASTSSIYGLQSGVMYETTTPEPVSLYARLKLRMEERVINAKSRYFHPTALRLATCYGISPRMRFDLVVNGFIRDACLRGALVVNNGEQYRPLIHVEDAAQAFVDCLKAHENLVSGEIFNVGADGQTVQVNYLANLVTNVLPKTSIEFLQDEVDLTDFHLSCAKIEKVLDFKVKHTIEDSMKELRDFVNCHHIEDPYHLKYNNTAGF